MKRFGLETKSAVFQTPAFEEIVETLSERYRAAAALMPSRIELCEQYGDTENEKVYFNRGQMERLWMERYCIHHPGVLNLRDTWFA